MATDSRVVPSATFSALGGGKVDEYEPLLDIPAVPLEAENEFDEKNDETFGGADFNEDWELGHERFAQEEEAGFFDFNSFGEPLESGAAHDANRSSIQDEPRPSVDDLFGPSSPPAFLDTEHLLRKERNIWDPLPNETVQHQNNQLKALFDFAKTDGKSPSKAPVGGLSTTSQASGAAGLGKAGATLEEVERRLLQSSQPAAASQAAAAPRFLNAADLERQLLGEAAPQPPQAPHPSTLPLPPGILRPPQMQPPTSHMPPHPASLPQNIPGAVEPRLPFGMSGPPMPGMGNLPHHHRQPPGLGAMARRLSDGRMSPMAMMGSGSSNHTPPSAQSRQSPLSMRHSPALGMSPTVVTLGRTTPTPAPLNFGASPPISRSPLPGARMVSPYFLAGSPSAGRMFPPQIAASFRNQSPLQTPFTRMPPPPMMMGPNAPHHVMRGMHPRHMANNQHPTGPPGPMDSRQLPRGPHPHFNRSQHSHQGGDQLSVHPSEDDFAGLMTQREKDWIIKIQLMQLQTDNPQLDDYYYTRLMLKKKAKERQKLRENGVTPEDSEPALLMPALVKVESKAYTPAHFEGSLGRLTTASVHNPRHIIDVKRDLVTAHHEEGGTVKNVSKELRRFRQLLIDIEKGYDVLLEVDDMEKQLLALPEESRGPHYMHRKEKIDELFKYFTSDDNFDNFMQALTVRKGRKLLARALPLFDKAQAQVIVSLALLNVPHLIKKDMASKEHQADESLMSLGEAVSRAVEHTEFDALTKYAEFLQKESTLPSAKPLQAILQHKFGCMLVCAMLQRGEDIYKNTSPVDMDEQLQVVWQLFVEEFSSTLENMSASSLQRPERNLQLLIPHVNRLLPLKTVSHIEDKVNLLATPKNAS